MKAKKAAAKNAGKGRKLEIKDLGGAGEAKGGAGVQDSTAASLSQGEQDKRPKLSFSHGLSQP